MGPLCIIGYSPCFDCLLGMGQIEKPVFIEAFIMEFADEALGKGCTRPARQKSSTPEKVIFSQNVLEIQRATGEICTMPWLAQ